MSKENSMSFRSVERELSKNLYNNPSKKRDFKIQSVSTFESQKSQ